MAETMSFVHAVAIPPNGFPPSSAAVLPSPAQSEGQDGRPADPAPTTYSQNPADLAKASEGGADRLKQLSRDGTDHALDMLLHFQASAITPPQSPNGDARQMEWSPVESAERQGAAAVLFGDNQQQQLASASMDSTGLREHSPIPADVPPLPKAARPHVSVDDQKDIDKKLLEYANLAINFSMSNKRRETGSDSNALGLTSCKKPRKGVPVRSLPPECSLKIRGTASSDAGSLLSPSFQGLAGAARSSTNVAGANWSTSSQISSEEEDSLASLPANIMGAYRDRPRRSSDASSQPFLGGLDRRSTSPDRSEDSFRVVPVAASLALTFKADGSHLFLSTEPEGLVTAYVDPDSDSERDEFYEELRQKMDQTFSFAAVDEMLLSGQRSRLLYWNDEALQKEKEQQRAAEVAASAAAQKLYETEPSSPVRRQRAEQAAFGTNTGSSTPRVAKPRVRKPAPTVRTTNKVFRSDIPNFPPPPATPKKTVVSEPTPIQTPRVSYDIENVEIKRVRKSLPHETVGAPNYTWNKGDPIKYGPADEYFDVLTKEEVKLCETIRLAPKLYLFVKDTMLTYKEENGYFKKLEAKKWFRLDVNKTGKVYDW